MQGGGGQKRGAVDGEPQPKAREGAAEGKEESREVPRAVTGGAPHQVLGAGRWGVWVDSSVNACQSGAVGLAADSPGLAVF